MIRRGIPAVAAALALALGGCGDDGGGEPELEAGGAFIPEPVTADMAGGFLTVTNTGDADDTLVSVTSDLTGTVEFHETVDNAMHQVESLPIPAGGELSLGRGGTHLMLIDLSRKPTEGETVSLQLHFETSDPITLDVPVEAATHTGE
ncbi:copper chaperone PCu(A)C [Streptomyces litchfieldiae]|uniref:Copper chaperone PCu(A)C n=1 Tax=Streptomyces litchfieldiae TaxID=3075543 RepID=A0ABU2MKP1_9ACTN|nr:copper chaperone PCu(A)C [Streptomyces sp. DSM 44938]MDT0342060.1 copper chaperone PCu(A)C [Streptomyces sp. DSM 44938]